MSILWLQATQLRKEHLLSPLLSGKHMFPSNTQGLEMNGPVRVCAAFSAALAVIAQRPPTRTEQLQTAPTVCLHLLGLLYLMVTGFSVCVSSQTLFCFCLVGKQVMTGGKVLVLTYLYSHTVR